MIKLKYKQIIDISLKKEMRLIMLKKILLIAILASVAIMTTSCSCNGNTETIAQTSSTATSTEAEVTGHPTEKPTTAEEAAADKAGLKVDEKGNVIDKNGKKVKVKDGKVSVEVDGKKVTVDTNDIKPVTNTTSTTSKSNNSKSSNSSSSNSSKTNSNNNSGTSSSTSSKNNSSSNSSSSAPSSTKTWHEAEYEYIDHPAETKQVWVVDQAAYTYDEPIYDEIGIIICNTCGADITNNKVEHCKNHVLNGEGGSYHVESKQVQIDTNTITVPEQGHYETKVVKEAWTEKKLVKEAGYY